MAAIAKQGSFRIPLARVALELTLIEKSVSSPRSIPSVTTEHRASSMLSAGSLFGSSFGAFCTSVLDTAHSVSHADTRDSTSGTSGDRHGPTE